MTATIKVNRAPVLTLWAAVVAERLGHLPSSLPDLSANPLILLNFAKTYKSMKSITYGLTPTGC